MGNLCGTPAPEEKVEEADSSKAAANPNSATVAPKTATPETKTTPVDAKVLVNEDSVQEDDFDKLRVTARKQRRRLSVTPLHVGDITQLKDPSQSPKKTDPVKSVVTEVKSREMRVVGKSQKGFVPHNVTKVNQDRFLAVNGLDGYPDVALFAVMDGHGDYGQLVSQFVKTRLGQHLAAQKDLKTDTPGAMVRGCESMCMELAAAPINIAFSGTTLVFCLRIGNSLYIGNIGDSRCVMAKQDKEHPEGNVVNHDLSVDQKPSDTGEKERILAAGGRVAPLPGYAPDEDAGPDRVWLGHIDVPGLAMSRSIGDGVAHTVGVLDVPEVKTYDLTQGEDLFMVLASDGVWEFLSSLDVVQLVNKNLSNLNMAASELVKESTDMWHLEEDVVDDITCLIVTF